MITDIHHYPPANENASTDVDTDQYYSAVWRAYDGTDLKSNLTYDAVLDLGGSINAGDYQSIPNVRLNGTDGKCQVC